MAVSPNPMAALALDLSPPLPPDGGAARDGRGLAPLDKGGLLMSTTLPTRQQVDQAEPLQFPNRSQDLSITIKATVDSFPCEIGYIGSIDGLLKVTARLRQLGAEPTIAPVAPAPAVSKKAA